jgi:hypothetical protein
MLIELLVNVPFNVKLPPIVKLFKIFTPVESIFISLNPDLPILK